MMAMAAGENIIFFKLYSWLGSASIIPESRGLLFFQRQTPADGFFAVALGQQEEVAALVKLVRGKLCRVSPPAIKRLGLRIQR